MNIWNKITNSLTIFGLIAISTFLPYAAIANKPNYELKQKYKEHSNRPSDINEHIPVLRKLTSECSSAVEIGVRSMVSTWGILQGLADSDQPNRSYIGIDLNSPQPDSLALAKRLCDKLGIDFKFWLVNDMTIDLEPVDLLFIDSLHTYCHLTYELENFSKRVRKYICMHDTSPPWESVDDTEYHGDYSEYPASYNNGKRGLWLAVADFLERHPEWELFRRFTNNHGFTILKRKVTSLPRPE